MKETKSITVPTESIDLTSPQQLVEFATTLKKFIVEQKLYTTIQGKNYVHVEGWEFAGAATGVMPRITKVIDKSNDQEIKYKARVELVRLSTDMIVGSGEAICSNLEAGMRNKDGSSKAEYAIASMAQTRAIGKAYRNTLAWLMKMAGYEPTPAEEMTTQTNTTVEPNIDDRIKKAKSNEELSAILSSLPVKEKQAATALIVKRMEELKDAPAK